MIKQLKHGQKNFVNKDVMTKRVCYYMLKCYITNLNVLSFISNGWVPLGFFSIADAFPMEIDKHQAMFGRYN